MTETMVERVAHAMAQRSDARQAGMYTINSLPMNGRENFLELAKAAIEAMPKITESEAYWIAYAALSAVDAHRDLNGMKQAAKAVMGQIEAFEAKRKMAGAALKE